MRNEVIVIRDELVSGGLAYDQRVETREMGLPALVYCAVLEKPSATRGFCHASRKDRQRLKA
jgi:hypothetical protein